MLGGVGEISGEVKDGVLFLSFPLPTKNIDGTDVVDLAGFKILKSCVGSMKHLRHSKKSFSQKKKVLQQQETRFSSMMITL